MSGSFAAQLADFQAKTEGKGHAVVREVVEEAGRRLIERSPVDTGAFASNWNYGLETRDTRFTTATNIRTLNNLAEMPSKPAGFIHYISNAAPYGPALERGSSQQAPQGMVGLTIVEWPQVVAEALRRVNP